MNKTAKITDTMLVWHMQWRPLTIEIIHLTIKTPGQMIKKAYIWSPFIMLKVYLLHTAHI